MLARVQNALLIHGGGLVDCSKQVLMRLASNLSKTFNNIYIGRFSFESLYRKEFWLMYNEELEDSLKEKRGTFFGTCRDIRIEGERLEKAISLLKENGIFTIIVCGGDGSSRQVSEINAAFEKEGIHIVFPIPLTLDGINGGESLGIKQAVRESCRQLENLAATALNTRDSEKFGVLAIELQGRNRDDVTAELLLHISQKGKIADLELKDIFLITITKTHKTDKEKLFREIQNSDKRTIILLSEAADIKMAELKEKLSRKLRTVVVGNQSQSNNQTTKSDEQEINRWVAHTTPIIETNIGKSYCIAKNGSKYEKKPIDYYAKLNPKEKQTCKLNTEQSSIIKKYTI